MNTSRLLIAAACSLSVFGASSVAFAQNTSSDRSNSEAQSQNPISNQGKGPASPSGATVPGTMNSTTQRQSDSATGNDSTGRTGTTGSTDTTDTTGTRMGRSTDDDNMRRSTDGSTMRTERLARADRN